MEEKIKNIVAQYTKLPVDQITDQTIVDRSAVTSSIILHRMYASLANEGIVVDDYLSVRSFGELLAKTNGKMDAKNTALMAPAQSTDLYDWYSPNAAGVGIDIEEISSMPKVNDYRADAFYQMNFSASEIAYCILQPVPSASFAGLFAAKEAIIKAGNKHKNIPFNAIIIEHLPEGKPYHKNYQLSISHTKELAIAVAAILNQQQPVPPANNIASSSPPGTTFLLAFTALLLAMIAILLTILR